MRILVTGGCGFIGSHLVKYLLNLGHDVCVLDNLSTGKKEKIPANAEIIIGDIMDSDTVARAVEGVDSCFHLAAIASVSFCHKSWYGSHCTNQSGFVNVLDNIRLQSLKQGKKIPVIYASSAAVYGNNHQRLPLSENLPLTPISVYGYDKYGCELQAKAAYTIYGIPTVGLRFFNVYGPGQYVNNSYSGVISNFIDCAISKTPLTIFGDGKQQRDFIYVEDVVKALVLSLQNTTLAGKVLNICTGRGTSVLELVNVISSLVNNKLEVIFASPQENDIRRSVGCTKLAEKELGFASETTLPEGLKKIIFN